MRPPAFERDPLPPLPFSARQLLKTLGPIALNNTWSPASG